MSGWAWFILILILLVLLSLLAWIFYTRLRARRAGRATPPLSSYIPFRRQQRHTDIYPTPSGIVGWAKSRLEKLKGSGGRGGAYEQPLEGGRRGRGRALDPDEAWDARVGAEADAGGYAFEEQELGLREEAEYGGGGYGNEGQVLPAYGEERGRSLNRGAGAEGYIGGGQRGLDERYEEEMGGREDPFGDEAERSELRGVSPRPHVEAKGDGKVGSGGGMSDDSPTERRSMFHENV